LWRGDEFQGENARGSFGGFMGDAHTFAVRYDEAALKSAVWAFLFDRWGGFPTLAVFALVVAGLIGFVAAGSDGWFAGFVSALLLVSLAAGALTWMLYWRRAVTKLRRLKTPVSTFTLSDDRIAVANDAGSMTLAWSAIREILDCGPCWLLVLDGQQFVTLPIQEIDAEALAFLRGKVAKFKIARGPKNFRKIFP
jgi:hypothetical protein